MKPDYTLYLVTDRRAMSTRTLAEAVEQAIAGGCTMVQLREAETSALDFYQLAVDIKAVTDRHHIPLIINNRIDIALAIRAAGVHLGQNDIPTAAARRIIGPNMLLGISVTTFAQALKAQVEGADYLGVGAMFPTKTKPDASIVTMEELRSIRSAVSLPIVAIGGITPANAPQFHAARVDGLAVISAILSKPDIEAAARELKQAFRQITR
ncbi:MAG: thiamine phosphate synthase [Hungatella hathewayi]|nr:thiamine phosphate synthase [Hungatella hathewayi]